jgi:transcriptional regulator with XRE-family HTH domain
LDKKLTIGLRIWQIADSKGITKAAFSKKLDISRQTFDNWIGGKTTPDHNDLLRASKLLDVDISEITLSQYKEDTKDKIPFYDAVAVGGQALLADQSPVLEPTEMIDPGTWFRSASGALRVYGHSMFPKYPSGCIVAFKASTSSVIVWGEDYVIELADRRIVKRVEKGETKDYIKAVSYNVNKDQKYVYDPIDIPLSEIKRLYMVLGKIELEASI